MTIGAGLANKNPLTIRRCLSSSGTEEQHNRQFDVLHGAAARLGIPRTTLVSGCASWAFLWINSADRGTTGRKRPLSDSSELRGDEESQTRSLTRTNDDVDSDVGLMSVVSSVRYVMPRKSRNTRCRALTMRRSTCSHSAHRATTPGFCMYTCA